MPIQFFVICSTTSRSVYLSNFLVTAFSTKEKIKFEEKLVHLSYLLVDSILARLSS